MWQFCQLNKNNAMLLSIASERQTLEQELGLVDRIRYKLTNQMRHFKEFNQFRIVISLLRKHMAQLEVVERWELGKVGALEVGGYLEAHRRIKNHIIRQAHIVSELVREGRFLPYATLALGCLARINHNLNLIETKLNAIRRVVEDLRRGAKKQHPPRPL